MGEQFVAELGHGVYQVDTGYVRPRMVASYILNEDGHVAIFDPGTTLALPRLREALKILGIAEEAVEYIVVTHNHLDNGSGAGALLDALPRAQFVAHPRAASNMCEPEDKLDRARQLFGDKFMTNLIGPVTPVNPLRTIEADDSGTLVIGDGERLLTFFHTPGHAEHHISIHDSGSNGIFAGDSVGIRYPDLTDGGRPFVFPSVAPSHFSPGAFKTSMALMYALEPAVMYMTHFGACRDVAALRQDMEVMIDSIVAIGRKHFDLEDRHPKMMAQIQKLLFSQARLLGAKKSDDELKALLGLDIELVSRGIEVAMERSAAKKANGSNGEG